MKKCLPDYQGKYPVWVWPVKPDLDRLGHLPEGTEGVCLELELDDKNVLLSDFDAWHCVLNDWPVEFEDDEFGKNPSQDAKTKSWEQIFDYRTLWQHPDWRTSTNKLQGTTGKVPISCVKDVTYFIAAKDETIDKEGPYGFQLISILVVRFTSRNLQIPDLSIAQKLQRDILNLVRFIRFGNFIGIERDGIIMCTSKRFPMFPFIRSCSNWLKQSPLR